MTKIIPTNANTITEIPERYLEHPLMENIQAQKMLDVLHGMDKDTQMTRAEIIDKLMGLVPNTMLNSAGLLVVSPQIEEFLQAVDENNSNEKDSNKEKPKNMPTPQPSVKKKKDLKSPNPYGMV